MNKKTSIIAITLLITAAVIFGFIFVNKGDGPIMGMILSDKNIVNIQDFDVVKSSKDAGLYLVLENEFNKFTEKTKVDIPSGIDIYASINFVECPKGSEFLIKWKSESTTIKEETKSLPTNQQGIISYLLEGSSIKQGKYFLELYSDDKKIFEYSFSAK